MYKLPIYNIVINDDAENDEELHMTCISLVDDPAVEVDFLKFEDNKQPMKFEVNQEEQCITGVAIRADKPIYRYNELTGEEYYVIFSKAVVKKLVDKYSKEGLFNSVSLQHSGTNITGVTLRELYIKDVNKGINPTYFSEVEDGSLFVTYHVEDADLWQEIKASGAINGFSIEVVADMELAGSVEAIFNRQSSSIIDYLLSDKKKSEFATKSANSALKKALDDKTIVDFTVDGNKTVSGAQIWQIRKQDGVPVVIAYADDQYGGRQWYIYEVQRVSNVRPGIGVYVDWETAMKKPSFVTIEKNLDIEDVRDVVSASAPSSEYERAIRERKVCIINYRDITTEPCTGARQCFVGELGTNTAGNLCLRAYQYYGATHTEGVDEWKMFRIDRILSFEVLDWMTPVMVPPPGFNLTGPDRDGFDCTIRADFSDVL